jgi:hypothetical protein
VSPDLSAAKIRAHRTVLARTVSTIGVRKTVGLLVDIMVGLRKSIRADDRRDPALQLCLYERCLIEGALRLLERRDEEKEGRR